MAILVGGFVLSKITGLNTHLEILNVLSPFTYFSIEDVVNKGLLHPVILLLSCLLSGGLLTACIYFYGRRDMKI